MRWKLAASVLVVGMYHAAEAAGDPYVPTRDDEVLAVVQRLGTLPRASDSALPGSEADVPRAIQATRAYLDANSSTGDPRYLGYALKTIEPWNDLAAPPRQLWLLRARLAQRLHRFDASQAELSALLQVHPGDPEALLLLSTVAIVRGDYGAARKACDELSAGRGGAIGELCTAHLAPYIGQARDGLARVTALLHTGAAQRADLATWILTLAAELSVGLGEFESAARYFETGLRAAEALGAHDQYLVGSYADFLTDQGEVGAALEILELAPDTDATLIRRAIATRAEERDAIARKLGDRISALSARQDRTHAREQAWFYLHVVGDAQAALRYAQQNWSEQREFRDARLLLEAAIAARSATAAEPVIRWLNENRIQHAWLDQLASQISALE